MTGGPGGPRPDAATGARKDEHLRAVTGGDVGSSLTTGLDAWRLRHRALPGIDLADVDLGTRLWGRDLAAPILLSCMTGGTASTGTVNANLARAAEAHRVALGTGSLRAALEDPGRLATYDVRPLAPSVPLLVNTGVTDVDLPALFSAAARLEADAVVVHLNPLQEALQPEGCAAFAGALDTIRRIVEGSPLPVLVKEVGFGLAREDVELLLDAGCAGVDVAGAGGTNWALVEGARSPRVAAVAAPFRSWGTPTAEALVDAVAVRDRDAPGALVIGSGGVRTGVDVAVAVCLGADLVGLAARLLDAATTSAQRASDELDVISQQLRVAAFAVGARTLADLDRTRLAPGRPGTGDDATGTLRRGRGGGTR